MAPHHRAAVGFGLMSLVASIPVAWFFSGLGVPGNVFGTTLWKVMPGLAVIFATAAAYVVLNLASTPRFGLWRGALAALMALVACAAVATPILIWPALVFVAWFVVPLGALAGWLLSRFVLHPNSTAETDARNSSARGSP